MEIIYGTCIEYDDMITIIKKIRNIKDTDDSNDSNGDFDIDIGEYKEYVHEIKKYLNSKSQSSQLSQFKKFNLNIHPNIENEVGNGGDIWLISYHVEYLGYYSTLKIPVLSEKIKSDIDKDYTLFCEHFNLNKNNMDFIIMIKD